MSTAAAAPPRPGRRRRAREIAVNLVAAPLFIVVVGLVPEPCRQISMAALMAVAAVVYLGHGLGRLERLFAAALAACAVAGLFSYVAPARRPRHRHPVTPRTVSRRWTPSAAHHYALLGRVPRDTDGR